MPGISVAVMIVIASFAIERISGALLFLLSYIPRWNQYLPDLRLANGAQQLIDLEHRHKLVSVVIASVLALGIVGFFRIQVLQHLGLTNISPMMDQLFTTVVLVAGSDQIRELIKGGGSRAAPPPPEPIHITGSLVLQESSEALKARSP